MRDSSGISLPIVWQKEAAMTSEQKRLPHNMAGIEFVACLEAIKEFLQKSWKHSQIHRHLKDEGKITMSLL